MKHGIFYLAAIAAIGGCATAGASSDNELSAKAAQELSKYQETGETKNCVSTNLIRSMDAIDDKNILVKLNNGEVWLNAVSGKCSGAGSASTYLQYTTSIGQLCRNDIIHVVDNSGGFMVGSCGLNEFQKLEKAPEEPAAD